MGKLTAFIVGARSPATDSLLAVLGDEQIHAAVVSLEKLGARLAGLGASDTAEPVLVSSTLSVAEVSAVCDVVGTHLGRAAQVVVFAESTAAGLERHVRTGRVYLVPPFRADVLRCCFTGDIGDATQAIDDAAHLARYEKELQIGREIQAGFLPDSLPMPPGWQIKVRFHPARLVAGDFYDAFDLVNSRCLGFVVADVCDKGVGAALFMALIRSLLRNTASHASSLSVVGLDVEWDIACQPIPDHHMSVTAAGIGPLLNAVTLTDRYMVQNHLRQGYFATLFFGMLDPATGSVVYINCGHNPPVVRRSDGTQTTLEPTGPALGMLPGSSFRLGRVQLGPGDLLYLYTDGVTEAKNEDGEFFTERRMRSVITESGTEDAEQILEHFEGELRDHIGGAEQFDDITMMALYREPDPRSAIGEQR